MGCTQMQAFFTYIVDATNAHFAIAERSSSEEKHREESFLAMGIEDAGRTVKETFLSLPSDVDTSDAWEQCLTSINKKLYIARGFIKAIDSGELSVSDPYTREDARNTMRGYHNVIVSLRHFRSLALETV